MNNISTITMRRELGEQERLLHNVHTFGGLIAVQMMDIEGPLSPELVRAGLDDLQLRHPLLRAHLRIGGIGTTREFPIFYLRRFLTLMGTKQIPLHVIEVAHLDEWHAHMQKQLNTSIGGRQMPLIRAVLLRLKGHPNRHRLLIACDHTIADAQAANLITNGLLEFFAAPENQPVPNSDQGLPPTLESRMAPKPGNSSKPYQGAIRIPTPYSHPWQRQTRILRRTISATQTKKVNGILAIKRTSMHGILCATALQAIGREYDMDELTLLSNVEFRNVCTPPLPENTFGCYIDIVRTLHKLDKPLWELANNVMFKLITTLARDHAGASILKMPTSEIYRKEGWGAIKSGMRLDAITVTTASETPIKSSYGPFKLKDLSVGVGLNTVGANYFLVSMEREGALELNLCYMHPAVRDAQANNLIEHIVSTLENLTLE